MALNLEALASVGGGWSSLAEPAPLVIVEGFLGTAGPALWGNFEEHANFASKSVGQRNRRTIFARVGPCSSLHDRACELFYSLVGGIVDYGEEHSKLYGHARHGRTYDAGLYPEWSRDRPLHFLGHSLGGPTIMKLQWLIKTGHFGSQYHPDMVLSVSAVSAPFRGTQVVYALGECTDRAPAIRTFSIGALMARAVHAVSYFSPVLPKAFDLHTDCRGLSFRQSSLWTFLKHLWHSDWAEGRDAAPFDVTFQGVDEREATLEGTVNPGTYYRSYTACMTAPTDETSTIHAPPLHHLVSTPLLYLSSQAMGNFDFSVLEPLPSFYPFIVSHNLGRMVADASAQGKSALGDAVPGLRPAHSGEAYWANDGVVPVFSQWHPFECRLTQCKHYPRPISAEDPFSKDYNTSPESGVWHVHHLDGHHHASIVPSWMDTSIQRMFWKDLGHWLRTIDAQRIRIPNTTLEAI
ncbi:hypothetical protein CERSUDRAFT_110436 [Gelatoporia subvermispora B]|uniref:Lipase-like C-terminal domain-containing protein n=1 Tax=Ceriporiopsis subvermispora (strain B) TaxID=914234 RepID=M2QXM8_CERS8|nr:hypothetical protein CERSUDRAFT_110436 [Gelatoporia subvermispora B]